MMAHDTLLGGGGAWADATWQAARSATRARRSQLEAAPAMLDVGGEYWAQEKLLLRGEMEFDAQRRPDA